MLVFYNRSMVCTICRHCSEWYIELGTHQSRRPNISGPRFEWKLAHNGRKEHTTQKVGCPKHFNSHHDLNRIFARASVTTADAGQCVSLALKRVRRSAVRKGMVIVAKTETPPKGA